MDGMINCNLALDRERLKENQERANRVRAEFLEAINAVSCIGDGVVVFGSARIQPDNHYYRVIEQTCSLLSQHSINIISGGGPGIMEAANSGAKNCESCVGASVGISIKLPHEQYSNPHINIGVDMDKFYLRKRVMVEAGNRGVIVAPGGLGTMDELFEVLCLIQTHKAKHVPVVLVGTEFWGPVLELLEHLADYGMMDREDMDLVTVLDEPQEIVDYILIWEA